MEKPTVENPKLQEIINDIWAESKNVIGDGSVMDAIRHERKKNVPLKGRRHSKKGRQLINRLEKWVNYPVARLRGM